MRMKETTAMIFGIIMGLVVLVGGLYLLLSPNVDCGGQTMSPGDTCVSMSGNGSSGESDYSGQQRGQQALGIGALVLGGLLAAGCGYALVSSKRQRRTSAPPTSHQKTQSLSFEELMTLGEKKLLVHHYADALNAFRQAAKEKPWDASAHSRCAHVLLHLHQQQEALKALDATLATSLLPNQKQLIVDASYKKALLLKEMKRYHEALETLDDLLQLDLENVYALARRAELLTLLQKQ
jgi:tetratricopeptide (TPR) repeat protein